MTAARWVWAVLALAALQSCPARVWAAELPRGFVRLKAVAPDIVQEIRYAGSDNFTGRPVPGYGAPECWLRRDAAEALGRVQEDAAAEGLNLVVYDCYRPERATAAFVRWAADPSDQGAKARFYPDVDKRTLFAAGYIARRSSHSGGTTVDAGFVRAGSSQPLDFGTPFDRFDPRSSTASPVIGGDARANRARLVALMVRHGFDNYPKEWWHFSLRGTAAAPAQDVEIR